MGWLRIGRVARAIGLQGGLGVAGSEGSLQRLRRIGLGRDGQVVEHEVEEARAQGKLWMVRVRGIGDRGAAEGWVGAEVMARRADLGEAGEGQHFWADLEGLPVVTVDGRALGRVSGLQPTGAVDVLVVTGGTGELLIPLAPYVTVEADRILVDPPEGLLELGRLEAGGTGGPGERKRTWPPSRSRS